MWISDQSTRKSNDIGIFLHAEHVFFARVLLNEDESEMRKSRFNPNSRGPSINSVS